jgi:DNA polymerase-3 subunit epsilon
VVQRSFDDLGTPLADVTFCVVDLETTGASPAECGITEIGVVKVRGGECLGTFQTLVNPGRAIPPEIVVLTGITESMVLPAPRIESVLPVLAEFMGGCVLVGHNLRFDVSFLDAAYTRRGWERLGHPMVDTHALARRLVRDEVPNCRLGTLASRLRLDHRPTHRALDDALATTDLLHLLLERAAGVGVLGLDDLLALPRLGGHPHVAKLRLTTGLPRTAGVYLFEDFAGRVLYVGKATNLRQRVRSYFSGDDRRKIGPLLRETQRIRHVSCRSTLEAAVTEIRLIQAHQPRYNQHGKRRASWSYVKLTLGDSFPRLSVVRTGRVDGAVYLGPLSTRHAQLVVDAVHTVVPLRRCAERIPIGGPRRDSPCAAAQLGVAHCPCAGGVDVRQYSHHVDTVVRAFGGDADLLLGALHDRMHALAGAARYEEAADARDRAAALAGALRRQHRLDALRRTGTLHVRFGDGGGAELQAGRLVRTWDAGATDALALGLEWPAASPTTGAPLTPADADELACVAAWLDAAPPSVRVDTIEGLPWVTPNSVRSFTPAPSILAARH